MRGEVHASSTCASRGDALCTGRRQATLDDRGCNWWHGGGLIAAPGRCQTNTPQMMDPNWLVLEHVMSLARTQPLKQNKQTGGKLSTRQQTARAAQGVRAGRRGRRSSGSGLG